MDEKRVYTFGNGKAEGKADMRNLLGGKGANLAEMNLIGVPVPPGFTITTDVCNEYFEKGKMIAVSGSLQTRKYEDKQGNKRTAYEVVARDVYFCGDKSEAKTDTKPISKPEEIEEIDDSEELPF